MIQEQHKPKLMAQVIYGTGFRKNDVHRLRVKYIDFDRNQIKFKRGKGRKDKRLNLPQTGKTDLKKSIEFVESWFLKEQREGIDGVELLYAMERKDLNA